MAEKPLADLLTTVREAPLERRAQWLEPVASHRAAAVERLGEWLYDPGLAPFAFDAILEAARQGAVIEARTVLAEVKRRQLDFERVARLVRVSDLVDAMPVGPAGDDVIAEPSLELVSGRVYRRRALHSAGLGADIFKGISYRATGGPVLLFSGKSGKGFGYRDGWDGGEYRYYGEWRGEGDMKMTAGNAAIADRSPHLYLFTFVRPGHYRFEGRFASAGYSWEQLERDGERHWAIVFRLRRVDDVVRVAG